MRIVKGAQILWLRSIVQADLTRFDLQLRLTQSPSLDKLSICGPEHVSPNALDVQYDNGETDGEIDERNIRSGVTSDASSGLRSAGRARLDTRPTFLAGIAIVDDAWVLCRLLEVES